MDMNVLQMFLGQIPEAIYFALFMIFTKELKEKRILFVVLMILEYMLLKYFIKFNIYFQLSYTALTFVILKILYKEKSQITDVFTFTIASLLLISIDAIVYFTTTLFTNNYLVAAIIDRAIIFLVLFLLRKKLPKIQKLYKKLWNRNDKEKKLIKSTTFRCINLIFFNGTFYAINLMMLFSIYKNSINQ